VRLSCHCDRDNVVETDCSDCTQFDQYWDCDRINAVDTILGVYLLRSICHYDHINVVQTEFSEFTHYDHRAFMIVTME
jgi:hypothetical protein